jgi:hypothetical protein
VSIGLVAIDGARMRRAYRDTARGDEVCRVSSGTAIGGIRCLPDGIASLADYGDAGCTRPIAALRQACSTSPPSYLYAADPRGVAIHAVDATAAQPTQRFTYGASCTAATLSPGSYVIGGAPLSFDVFAAGTQRVE